MSNDIFNILAFSALIISLLVEVIFSATWNQMYFTIGLPLFTMRIPVINHYANIPPTSIFDSQSHSAWLGSLVFKEIGPNNYAFREKFFELRLLRYSPIMHGLLVFDDINSQVIVKGFANWFLLVFSLIWLSIVIASSLSTPIIALPFVVFFTLFMGLLYVIQHSRFSKIATLAAQAWSKNHVNKTTGA